MFGGQHTKNLIEKVYCQNEKNMELTLDIFLTGNIPNEKEELHVIIDKEIDMPISEIKTVKKKEDLRKYILSEYGGILGQNQKLTNNKYYQNHLRALELQRQEEEQDKQDLKIKIMAQADMMTYDDDFDSEDERERGSNKYGV